jgi:hypothetical protein
LGERATPCVISLERRLNDIRLSSDGTLTLERTLYNRTF